MARLALDGGTPVRPTMLDHRRGAALLGAEEQAAVARVVASQSLFCYYGPDLQGTVEAFERGVEEQLGVPHALATSSGTGALTAALAALDVGPGDEVVVPAVTFVATANAVVVAGAVPVFCDVDDGLGMDPGHLAALLTERTAAVVPVHLENVVCDMAGILSVTRPQGVPVLEDACQAMGATYFGRPAGTLGDVGAFSLQLEKNITAGEGGVVVTADPDLHLRAARYTDQGGQFVTSRGSRGSADVDPFVGENLRMTEVAGAIAGVQLGRLPGILEAMRGHKRALLKLVGDHPDRVLRHHPDPEGDGGSSALWYLPTPELAVRFVDALLAEGVPAATLYAGRPVYANPAYATRRTVSPKRSPWARHPAPPEYRPGLCPRGGPRRPRCGGRPRPLLHRARRGGRGRGGAEGHRGGARVRPVRVGVLGCGAISLRAHVPLLAAAGAELVAFASRRRLSAERAADLAGTGTVCDGWQEVLARDDVEAVVVATPNAQHAEQALAAVAAGKHVLVEKPFTVTVADADRLLAAADRAGVVVMAAHNMRFAAPLVAAREVLAAGTLGRVTSFRAVFCHAGPLAWSAEAGWFLDPVLAGGGALLDLGVHLVDALRFLLADEVTAVSATLAGVTNGLEQDGFALLETRDGAVGGLHAGWRSSAGRDLSVVVLGERGTLRVGAEGVTVTDTEGVARPVPLPASGETVQDAFVRAVRAGRAGSPDGYDGRAAVAVVQAAYEAARTGCRTAVPPPPGR